MSDWKLARTAAASETIHKNSTAFLLTLQISKKQKCELIFSIILIMELNTKNTSAKEKTIVVGFRMSPTFITRFENFFVTNKFFRAKTAAEKWKSFIGISRNATGHQGRLVNRRVENARDWTSEWHLGQWLLRLISK
jgi:hypothetical protein